MLGRSRFHDWHHPKRARKVTAIDDDGVSGAVDSAVLHRASVGFAYAICKVNRLQNDER